MKPPDEKIPEELRILEQMPWLNNPNNTIPTVDPADIKAVACSPGADIASVVYRLGLLELANTAMGLNFPLTQDGKPTDAVFKAFATIPMQGIPEGGSNTPRFDVFELVKMILKEAEA